MADTPDVPDCNPVLFRDAKDRLWLFWIVVHNNRWEHSILKYRRADKFGADGPPAWTWQDIIILKPGADLADHMKNGLEKLNADDGMWSEYALPYSELLVEAAKDPRKRDIGWMTRAQPVALPSGRILLPLYSDGFNASLVAITDDLGESWHASKPIIGLGPIQPTIARRANGNLVAYCRDSGRAPARVLASESQDNGETWPLALDTELPTPGSSLAAVTLRPWKRYLDSGAADAGSFSYPTAIEGKDGRIHVTYSYRVDGGAAIKHAAFDPDWLKVEAASSPLQ
jgi:predicted neuraminidase